MTFKQWLKANMDELRTLYAGEWVFIYNEKVVAHAQQIADIETNTFIDGALAKEITPERIFIEPE